MFSAFSSMVLYMDSCRIAVIRVLRGKNHVSKPFFLVLRGFQASFSAGIHPFGCQASQGKRASPSWPCPCRSPQATYWGWSPFNPPKLGLKPPKLGGLTQVHQ